MTSRAERPDVNCRLTHSIQVDRSGPHTSQQKFEPGLAFVRGTDILLAAGSVDCARIRPGEDVSKIRQLNDASVLDAPKPRPRELSPAALARQKEYERLRDLMGKLNDPNQVYEIVLDASEKPLTVRQRLLRVASESGKEIVVRKYGKNFAIGLMTPERRSRRGRKPKGS